MRWKRRKKDMPSGLWLQCPDCKKPIFRQEMEKRKKVCPDCSYHFPLNAAERIAATLDEGSFDEMHADLAPSDRLEFVDTKAYKDRLDQAQAKTGLKDAAVVGVGKIKGIDVAFGVLDFSFIGGSMGYVVGEKIARITETAIERNLPLILFSGSGGARMMEGAISLMQMGKTCAALARLDEAKGFYVSVLTNPTTGGVTASYASMGDVTIAEPGALIGFAGPRVIKTTIKQELPEGFQTSEFMLEHGFVDRIVSRAKLRDELAHIIGYFTGVEPQEPEGDDRDAATANDDSATATAADDPKGKSKAKAKDKSKGKGKDKEKSKDADTGSSKSKADASDADSRNAKAPAADDRSDDSEESGDEVGAGSKSSSGSRSGSADEKS